MLFRSFQLWNFFIQVLPLAAGPLMRMMNERFQHAVSDHEGGFIFREYFSLAERLKLADTTL